MYKAMPSMQSLSGKETGQGVQDCDWESVRGKDGDRATTPVHYIYIYLFSRHALYYLTIIIAVMFLVFTQEPRPIFRYHIV